MRRTVFFRLWTGIVASAALGFAAPGLGVLPEHVRADPFGGMIEADRSGVSAPARSITLEGTRAAYVSCRIVVSVPEGEAFRLEIASFGTGLEADLYREGFHLPAANVRYYPDALVPARMPYRPCMPEPDNRIAGQTVQAYEPAVIAFSALPLPKLRVSAPAQVHPGDTAQIALSFAGASPAQTHVLHVEVLDPAGAAARHYTSNVLAAGGVADKPIPFAVNDATGKWTVRVKDMLSGQVWTASIGLL